MKPIVVRCRARVEGTPASIRARFVDVAEWADFAGYGPIPGIREARFVERTEAVVGSRIAVENRDGSRHVEEILTFDDDGVSLRLDGFTPPLSALATHSVEELRFTPEGDATHVERSMALHAKRWWSYPLLWLISWFVGAALRRHLRSL